MSICSIEDCGVSVLARSYCRKHYKRWYRYGDPNKTDTRWSDQKKSFIERFNSRIELIPFSTCWWWTGTQYGNGYGCISKDGKKILAHRASYEIHNSQIGDDLNVCHTCDNPACVNPDHLWLGTQQDNVDDMMSKGRGTTGSKQYASKLKESDVLNIRGLSESVSTKELSLRFGVSASQINRVISRDRWSHI